MGLHKAWPEAEIWGVDIKPQPRYPFKFMQGDWCEVGISERWDFVWASPPCQRYSTVTPPAHRMAHPDLICLVRQRLKQCGTPYVIENVVGAYWRMNYPIMLCGSMFGLRTRRHRLFEGSFKFEAPKPCDHSEMPLLVTTAGANSRAIRKPGAYKSVKNALAAYGIDWMDFEGLKEAIPPAYSEYIALEFTKS